MKYSASVSGEIFIERCKRTSVFLNNLLEWLERYFSMHAVMFWYQHLKTAGKETLQRKETLTFSFSNKYFYTVLVELRIESGGRTHIRALRVWPLGCVEEERELSCCALCYSPYFTRPQPLINQNVWMQQQSVHSPRPSPVKVLNIHRYQITITHNSHIYS